MDIPKQLPASASDDQTDAIRDFTISCIVLVFSALVLRTAARYCLKLRYGYEHVLPITWAQFLGMDDVFNLLAVLTFWGLTVAVLIAIDRGMGVHIEVVLYRHGVEGLDRYNLAVYFCAIFYNTTLGMVKLSVLSLYRRILAGIPSRTLPVLNWVAFGIVSANTTINVCVAAFQCHPIAAAFDSSVKGRCINQAAFYLGNASTGIFTDVMVYGLSIPIVKPLQMEPKKKLQTLLTLLMGGFAVITSCVRMGFLPDLLKNPDATYAMAIPMAWSVAEPTVGIIASSMPAMRAIRYLWSPEKKNNSSSASRSNPRSERHMQLQDLGEARAYQKTSTGHDTEILNDDDSEEHLVQGRGGAICRTTRVEVSYR